MAATRLSQYQAALRHLGEARLDLITDDVEAKYALDDAWTSATEFVLRQAPWRFALRQGGMAAGGTVVQGYTTSYLFPNDWLRTHAVFQYSGVAATSRECPVDFRERGTEALSVDASGTVVMRYVSSDFVDPELADNPWPEHFAQAHAAYLAFSIAERVTGEPGAAGRMSDLFASLLPEAIAIDAVPEDPWLPHQRSGAFRRVSRAMAGEAFWRFAMPEPATIATIAGGGGGFAREVALPSDWLRTRSLYKVNDAEQKRPFDIRERNGQWLTNETAFYAEYVSTDALDARLWPDLYMEAVRRKLEFEFGGIAGEEAVKTTAAVAEAAFLAARQSEADAPDPWLAYQLSGQFARCVPAVISKGYWRFALKARLYSAEIDQDQVDTDGAYPYRFTLPDDWFKTHAIFVPFDGAECPIDVREREGRWYTATVAFMARYVSTAALDPASWPDSLAKAVLAYLDLEAASEEAKKNAAELWAEALDAARVEWSAPENPWLRFQLDGRYFEAVKFVLSAAAGRWSFAIKTVVLTAAATIASDGTVSGTVVPTGLGDGTISPSYGAVFTKPGDWYRTVWMYRVGAQGVPVDGYSLRQDIDFRDEGGSWHTNYTPVQVRYLSRDGLDSTRQPASFRNAVLTWLEYEEARFDPKLTNVAARKLELYSDILKRAKSENYTRERPLLNQTSRFVRGRRGGTGAVGEGNFGIPVVGSAGTVLADDSGTVILTP